MKIYLLPFDPPAEYIPATLASGVTANGQFSESFAFTDVLDAYERRFDSDLLSLIHGPHAGVNAILLAADPEQNWRALHHFVLPFRGSVQDSVVAQMDISSFDYESVDGPVTIERSVCVYDMSEDQRVDPGAGDVDYQDSVNHASDDLNWGGGEPAKDPLKCVVENDTVENQTLESVISEAAEEGVRYRWSKVNEVHTDYGMKLKYQYIEGQESSFQLAAKDAFGAAFISGWMMEQNARNSGTEKNRDEYFNKYWRANYRFVKQLTCDPETCWWEWYPDVWTGELHASKNDPVNDWTNRDHIVRVGYGDRQWTRSQDSSRIGLSFSIWGLGLSAEAGYSSITYMEWKGTKQNCDKELWGKNGEIFTEAGTIYAQSNCPP